MVSAPPQTWLQRLHAYRWWVWSAFAVLWTIGLLYPLPERHAGDMLWQDYLRYYVGKTLHVIAYAVFAILSGWLNVRAARRWILMFALMAHAGVTEWLQTFVGRNGMPSDVVRNYAGITLGVAASWRSWWRED